MPWSHGSSHWYLAIGHFYDGSSSSGHFGKLMALYSSISYDWRYRDSPYNNHDRASWMRDNYLRPNHGDEVAQSRAAFFNTTNNSKELQPNVSNQSNELFARHDPAPTSTITYSYIPPSKLPLAKQPDSGRKVNWRRLATGQPDIPVHKPMAVPPPEPLPRDLDQESRGNLTQVLNILHKPRRIYYW